MGKIEKVNSGLDWIIFALGILGNVCTIVTTFIAARNGKNLAIILSLSFGIILIIIFFWYYLNKSNIFYYKSMKHYSNLINTKSSTVKNSWNIVRDNLINRDLSKETINGFLENTVRVEIETLASLLSSITKDTICVCVKYIEYSHSSEKLIDSSITTLARSGNSQNERNNRIRPVNITDVTDFLYFAIDTNDEKDDFYCENLSNLRDYRNTYHWQNHYKTKIVIPIRIKKSNVYRYLGFICADCINTNAFEDQLDACKSLICATANNLYTYLSYYRYYHDELVNAIENNEKKGKGEVAVDASGNKIT